MLFCGFFLGLAAIILGDLVFFKQGTEDVLVLPLFQGLAGVDLALQAVLIRPRSTSTFQPGPGAPSSAWRQGAIAAAVSMERDNSRCLVVGITDSFEGPAENQSNSTGNRVYLDTAWVSNGQQYRCPERKP